MSDTSEDMEIGAALYEGYLEEKEEYENKKQGVNMKTRITKIYKSDTKKDGTALITKAGKPYTRITIQVPEHGDKWLSGFFNPGMNEWKIGSMIEIEVEQNGQWLNFKTPNRNVSREEFDILVKRVDVLGKGFIEIVKAGGNKTYDTTKKEDRDQIMKVIEKKPDIEFDDKDVPLGEIPL